MQHPIKKTCLLLLPILLAGGCDIVYDTVAEYTDETEMQRQFVQACAEGIEQNSPIQPTPEWSGNICNCAYEHMAQSYPDRETWKKTLIRESIEKGTEILQRGEAAITACLKQNTQPTAERKPQP